ncbi:hypothetical protein GIB67_011211, partial [Kingdonia uniflora]
SLKAREVKEKLLSIQTELEHAESQVEDLKLVLKETNKNYKTLLGKSKHEIDLLKTTVQESSLEVENSKTTWSQKELNFMNSLNNSEEETCSLRTEVVRLIGLLKEAEQEAHASKKEGSQLQNLCKFANNTLKGRLMSIDQTNDEHKEDDDDDENKFEMFKSYMPMDLVGEFNKDGVSCSVGVSGHTEKDAPTAKRHKTVATGLIDEDLDVLRGREKEPLSQSFVEEGTRLVGSGKLFVGSLPEGEEAVHHELAQHVVNVTGGFEERVKILSEEKLQVEGDLGATHGHLKALALEKLVSEQALREQLAGEKQVSGELQDRVAELVDDKTWLKDEFCLSTEWWVATLALPLLIMRQTQDVPELPHLGLSAQQGPVPFINKMDITLDEEAQLVKEDKAASVADVQPEV